MQGAVSVSTVMPHPQRFSGDSVVFWSDLDITISVPWYLGLMFRTRKEDGVLMEATAGMSSRLHLQVSGSPVPPWAPAGQLCTRMRQPEARAVCPEARPSHCPRGAPGHLSAHATSGPPREGPGECDHPAPSTRSVSLTTLPGRGLEARSPGGAPFSFPTCPPPPTCLSPLPGPSPAPAQVCLQSRPVQVALKVLGVPSR